MSALNVLEYIPQRPPMVMIGEMVRSDALCTVTRLQIAADNALVNLGYLSEAGLMENIAQTAALHAGYNRDLSKPVLLGFIGALKDVRILELPKTGDTIETSIKIAHEVLGATIINGEVRRGGQVLAACEMKIFLQEA